MRKLISVVLILVSGAVGLFAAGAPESSAADVPVRIALLPIMDSIPYHVAQKEGYFTDEGIDVQLLVVNSPIERDQLMQAGEIDLMLNEVTSAALFNRAGTSVKVVSGVRRAAPGAPVFRILASPGSDISSPTDLAGVSVAVSKNSIIEYLTDRILAAEGLDPADIVTGSVPVIPERFQLLMAGKVPAATLPDPLASAALRAGAIQVVDDSAYGNLSQSVLSARADFAADHADTLRAFLRAWDKAAAALNQNPEEYRQLIIDSIPVPAPIQADFPIPTYSRNDLPSQAEWQDAVAWLKTKGLLSDSDKPDFAQTVTESFLP